MLWVLFVSVLGAYYVRPQGEAFYAYKLKKCYRKADETSYRYTKVNATTVHYDGYTDSRCEVLDTSAQRDERLEATSYFGKLPAYQAYWVDSDKADCSDRRFVTDVFRYQRDGCFTYSSTYSVRSTVNLEKRNLRIEFFEDGHCTVNHSSLATLDMACNTCTANTQGNRWLHCAAAHAAVLLGALLLLCLM